MIDKKQGSLMKINNSNIEEVEVRAVVIGVGVEVKEKGVAVTHTFNVELPSYVSREVQAALSKHFGSVNSLLKLNPNEAIGEHSTEVRHRELEGLNDTP